jgi:hypothetical protein
MPLSRKLFALVCTVGAAGLAGCMHASPDSPPPVPTTMPMPETNMKTPGPTTMAVPSAAAAAQPPAAAPAAKDMTHSITKDQPYFTAMPGAGVAPAGMLKAGSKVLVIVPDASFSQVVTDMGISAYTSTDGLKPLGK